MASDNRAANEIGANLELAEAQLQTTTRRLDRLMTEIQRHKNATDKRGPYFEDKRLHELADEIKAELEEEKEERDEVA